jgi:hypothetical protein
VFDVSIMSYVTLAYLTVYGPKRGNSLAAIERLILQTCDDSVMWFHPKVGISILAWRSCPAGWETMTALILFVAIQCCRRRFCFAARRQ